MPSEKNRLFLIPGLGADARIFSALELNEPFEVIEWLPANKGETLAEYAARMAEPIDCENPIIIGVSFGGIVASEIAKQRHVEKIVIVSSVKTKHEIPLYIKFAGKTRILDAIPKIFLTRKNRMEVVYYFFGVNSDTSKAMLRDLLRGSEPDFMRWSVARIGTWKNTEAPAQLVHIHGTKDRVFPFRRIRGAQTIEGGHHFMIYDRAAELSALLNCAMTS